jgi:hypothetical protein
MAKLVGARRWRARELSLSPDRTAGTPTACPYKVKNLTHLHQIPDFKASLDHTPRLAFSASRVGGETISAALRAW